MTEENEKRAIEQIEEIKKKIGPGYLALNRVPKDTRDWFFDFVDKEFVGDRGMAFKWLCDQYRGILDAGTEHLELSILDLNERMMKLEEAVQKPVEVKLERTRLDGKPIND